MTTPASLFKTQISSGLARLLSFCILINVTLFATCFSGPLPIVSEVLADPSALSDAQGEFVELGNPLTEALEWNSFKLILAGDTLKWVNFKLNAGKFYLICRDSLTMSSQGIECKKNWPGLSLVNSLPISITLISETDTLSLQIPKALSGISWENTWQAPEFLGFDKAQFISKTGDKASPGDWNSRASNITVSDLVVEKASIQQTEQQSTLVALIRNQGGQANGAWRWYWSLDNNLDGVIDAQSRYVDMPALEAGQSLEISTTLPSSEIEAGIVTVHLQGDVIEFNNSHLIFSNITSILTITEFCPAPDAKTPEWVEIKNQQAYPIRIDQVELNGIPIGLRENWLNAREYAILTPDSNTFIQYYGFGKWNLFESSDWNILRNTGDTVSLSWKGNTISEIPYSSLKGDNNCYQVSPGLGQTLSPINQGASSPGYSPAYDTDFSLQLSSKIINRDDAHAVLDLRVGAPALKTY